MIVLKNRFRHALVRRKTKNKNKSGKRTLPPHYQAVFLNTFETRPVPVGYVLATFFGFPFPDRVETNTTAPTFIATTTKPLRFSAISDEPLWKINGLPSVQIWHRRRLSSCRYRLTTQLLRRIARYKRAEKFCPSSHISPSANSTAFNNIYKTCGKIVFMSL